MTSHLKVDLDPVSWKILEKLQENARMSFTELSRDLNISAPAVAERVRRLEESGVIQGYSARVDRTALGYPVAAFVSANVPPQQYSSFTRLVEGMPIVIECYHTTGPQSFILKIVADSVEAIASTIEKLSAYGATQTSVVLGTPIHSRTIGPKGT